MNLFQIEGPVNPFQFMAENFLLFIFIFLGIVILHFSLALWVYKDSTKREFVNRGIWTAIVALSGIFGFIAYLLVARKE